MFDNIGGKIKKLAQIVTWIGIISSSILGLISSFSDILVGGAIALVGIVVSWISSFVLYGLGELIENSNKIVENTNQISENTKKNSATIDKTKLSELANELKRLYLQGRLTEAEYINALAKLTIPEDEI